METRELLEKMITDFVRDYQGRNHTMTAWQNPVIGVADAEDPLFAELKNIIGPAHAMPSDLVPGAKSVLVYFIPFAGTVGISNIPDEESSKEWDYACIETNNMLKDLNICLYSWITEKGYHASQLPPTYHYDQEKLISSWSHKSAAYIAGIGKFGVHQMLITEKGCCGRIGSVITDMRLEPTARTDEEYCLFKTRGICGRCMERCVNQAFSVREGRGIYDRYKCNEQIYDKIVPHYPIGDGDTCGKCMCGVPYSFGIPGR